MKYLYLSFVFTFLSLSINAQQEIILTKYTFNEMFFNPAFAGSTGEDQGTVSLQYRNQWLGVDGAPSTFLLAGEYSFFENKLGIGVTLGQEKIGVNSNTEATINTTYRVQLGEGYLSGGIRTGFSNINSDFSKLKVKDAGDIFGQGTENITLFGVGAGLLYHLEAIKLGVSMPTIASISEGSIKKAQHLYGHMELRIGDEYSTIYWQPNLLVKYEKSVPLQLTLGLQIWFKNRFAPGIHFRVGESAALSFEVLLDDRFNLTAAYDFTTNDLHDYSSGSMELMLSYKFGEFK